MAPDVIDLISSSPSPPFASQPQPQTRHSSNSTELPTLTGSNTAGPFNHAGNAALGQLENSRPRISQHYDDVDEFDDIDDSVFDLLDERQAKRRRVMEQNIAQNETNGATSGMNSIPKPLPLKDSSSNYQNRAALEPIEFTSSLEPNTPATKCVDINRGQASRLSIATKAVDNVAKADPIMSFSSDPFASSPSFAIGGRPSDKRAVSLDPFCSSPPPSPNVHRSRIPRPGRRKESSCSPRQIQISRTQEIEATEVVDLGSLRGRQAAKNSTESIVLDDLISIDDSDSSNDSNDELPAITDIDPSKRRARSPLRRSQSDITWSKSKTSYAATSARQRNPKKTTLQREAEKERKRQEREQAKAAKLADKQRAAAVAEVNKLRTDKKVSAPEMIADLPSCLSSELRIQVQEMLQGLGVEHSTWDCPEHSIIKWRRKVTCKFNDDMGLWEPIPPRVVDEDIAIVILTAEELVAMASEDTLTSHVTDIKSRYKHTNFVYILQGMVPWLRKNRNNRNRQFTSGVRSANSAAAPSSRARVDYISEDIIEDAMLALQVEHDMLIHHTTVATETARWVVNFTQHVSTIPYKKQRDQATSVAGFCMESGQVRTGDSVHDTYVRLLQEIVRVTAPIAYGIAAEFDTVTKLVKGLEQGGPETLEAVRKSANKDGAVSDRTIGQAVSRRMYKVFTGKDEESTDV